MARFRRSLQSWPELIGGAVVWGLAVALCALLALWWRNHLQTPELMPIFRLYFSGAAAGYILAVPIARFIALGQRGDTRFAACFLCLSLLTICVTATIFALEYRHFYAQWHDEFLSRSWIFQLVFTTAGAVYQFAVMGLPLYMPQGIVLLVVASFILARRMR